MKVNAIKDEYSNEISFNQTDEKPVNNKISGNENKNNTNDRKNIVSKRKYLKLAINMYNNCFNYIFYKFKIKKK